MTEEQETAKEDLPIWDYPCDAITAYYALEGVLGTLKEFHRAGLDPDVVNVSIGKRSASDLENDPNSHLIWEGRLFIRGEKRWPNELTAMWEKDMEEAVEVERPEA